MNDHHQKDGKWVKDKEPIDSVTKKDVSIAPHFSHGDSSRAIHHILGIYRGSLKKMQSQPGLFNKSVRFDRTELSIRGICRSSRKLQF